MNANLFISAFVLTSQVEYAITANRFYNRRFTQFSDFMYAIIPKLNFLLFFHNYLCFKLNCVNLQPLSVIFLLIAIICNIQALHHPFITKRFSSAVFIFLILFKSFICVLSHYFLFRIPTYHPAHLNANFGICGSVGGVHSYHSHLNISTYHTVPSPSCHRWRGNHPPPSRHS